MVRKIMISKKILVFRLKIFLQGEVAENPDDKRISVGEKSWLLLEVFFTLTSTLELSGKFLMAPGLTHMGRTRILKRVK